MKVTGSIKDGSGRTLRDVRAAADRRRRYRRRRLARQADERLAEHRGGHREVPVEVGARRGPGLGASALRAAAMECPKCSAICADDAVECPRCGVVVAKAAQRAAHATVQVAVPVPAAPVAEMPDVAAGGAVRVARILRLIARTRRLDIPVCERRPWASPRRTGSCTSPTSCFTRPGTSSLACSAASSASSAAACFSSPIPLVLAGAFLRQRDWFGAAVFVW